MADPLDPALARKLEAFTVPELPAGFADAVLARARALPGESSPPPLPRLRKPPRGRWWRAGASTLGVLAAATISISAAASGYLGEPIRRAVAEAPVIGPVVERVIHKAKPKPEHLVARQAPARNLPPSPAPLATTPATLADLRAARREAIRNRLAHDPQARQWLADHPRAAARLARRAGIAGPELRAERRQRIAERRAERRAELGLPPRELAPPPFTGMGGRPLLREERIERLRLLRERRLRRLEAMQRVPGGEAGDE